MTPRRGWCGALGERVRRDVVVSEGHGRSQPVNLLAGRWFWISHVQMQAIGAGRGRQGMHCAAPLYVRLRS